MPLERLASPLIKNALLPFGCLHMVFPDDLIDEYVQMCESTGLESMYRFCRAVIAVFGPEYLREPTTADTTRLLSMNASRGFSGMLGSIDCMHWKWKNYPCTCHSCMLDGSIT